MISAGTFVTVAFIFYGVFYRTIQDGGLDARLGGLRYNRPGREALPDAEASFIARVVQPMVRSLTKRANSVLPNNINVRLEGTIARAGLTLSAGQYILITGIAAGAFPVLVLIMLALGGNTSPKMMLGFYAVLTGMGIYGPRMWLLGKVKRRQKAIWRSLPDAFDLITASVEAGLGIDAALTRVIEKVQGPFAVELTRTMREITMGRSRREALLDMADRTGVEELRSLINAIVQAESMGISIGGVIRVQTGVIRTKRKQKAEEQAFKAPIKMVFPLVLFIFPCIMIVIGGPAIIQVKNSF
ncbi:MAG: type II secretion system F family protein [Dehalococcoidia bacterium]